MYVNFTGILINNLGIPVTCQNIVLILSCLKTGSNKIYWITTNNNGEFQLTINLNIGKYAISCNYVEKNQYNLNKTNATIILLGN
jgi:hypothetical protein